MGSKADTAKNVFNLGNQDNPGSERKCTDAVNR